MKPRRGIARLWITTLVIALTASVASNFWLAQRVGAQRLAQPRIVPVAKDAWTDAQREILEPLEAQGRAWNVFTTMANHPALAKDWLQFGAHILSRNTLPAREREILILRIGWLCRSEYEWAQHARIGKTAGLTDVNLQQIMDGPDATGVAYHDRLLMQAVDQLHEDAFIADDTSKTYNTQQMMDLVFTVGQYNMVSMALNSFGVELDPGIRGFPPHGP